MGLLDLLNISTKTAVEDIAKELEAVLSPNETIAHAYKMVRDYFVFTNWRLLMVNKQGVTGKKVEYHSVPYRSVTHFSVETAGHFDLEGELKIWVSGRELPFERSFSAGTNILEVQRALATHIGS
ncbi:PH domain-containing protein [Luteibacter sp. UNC138MFCol5.1]|uniref:PH domain-containing protein n=1 Tax=Luteibacter sp. UNC138MFCol5.1 TaxID=1502774 RepID=UPI0008C38178|nr:PH domain-containing protein [Luteibacter sp. UNC138MFCol5.1]SEO76850.1 PH domain-containing protein [Luteibacter sp. UNC138MFCol5.1]